MTERDQAYQAVLAKHARSFRWASVFLPEGQRRDAAVVYAFCRHVDDTADEAPDPEVARRELTSLRAEVARTGEPSALVSDTLEVFGDQGPGRAAALELIDGVASDLTFRHLADDGELLRYSYRVASTVGLMMIGVLGVTSERAWPHAVDLGVAMQLTNICRDVLEDAHRGRVYLPRTRLEALGLTPEALVADPESEAAMRAVPLVVSDLLQMAERYYDSADQGMKFIPLRSRLAILVASRVYRAIGRKLMRQGGNPLRGRTIVGAVEKLFWVGSAIVATMRLAWSSGAVHNPSLHQELSGLPGTHASRVQYVPH